MNSLQYRILSKKEELLEKGINDLSIISFLEEAIKEILNYYLYFIENKMNFLNQPKETLLIFYELVKNFKNCTFSYNKIINILKFFNLEKIFEKEKQNLKALFSKRNNFAHFNYKKNLEWDSNFKKERISNKIIFDIVQKLYEKTINELEIWKKENE